MYIYLIHRGLHLTRMKKLFIEKAVHMQDKDTRFACKHFICMLSEELLLIQCCYMRSF